MADGDVRVTQPSPSIPGNITSALTTAAEQIETLRTLLPENQVTRSDVAMVHLISDADLVKLRYAGRASLMTNSVQMWFGAAIGLAIPAIAAVKAWAEHGNLAMLTLSEHLTIMAMGICAGVSITLYLSKWSQDETVDKLCDQIEGRPRKKTP